VLDAGETAAISLAAEIKADLLLIDESKGRAVGVQLGLRVAGVLGVLLQAKGAGFVEEIAPLVQALQSRALFWLDEKTKMLALTAAGEPPSA
jgi:predicted nucleic acid-binding protein